MSRMDREGHEAHIPEIAPDPARDARRAAYQERERRRAARALDRFVAVMFGPDLDAGATRAVAGDRFIEAVGDYVLSRLHHNGDYGVARPADPWPWPDGDEPSVHPGVMSAALFGADAGLEDALCEHGRLKINLGGRNVCPCPGEESG